MRRVPFALLSIALLPFGALAAPAAAQENVDSQIWLTARVATSLGGDFDVEGEAIHRFGDDADGLYEGEYIAMLGWKADDAIKLAGGYVRNIGHSRAGVTSKENRLRAQATYTFGLAGHTKLDLRLRSETRWREGADETGHRLRPFARLIVPLDSKPKPEVTLVASHESFVNLNNTSWGQRSGYERMRNLIAVAFPLPIEGVGGEAGYLNQYRFGRGGSGDTMDNVASLAVSYKF